MTDTADRPDDKGFDFDQEDVDETPDEEGAEDAPHPMGPHADFPEVDPTDSDKWLGEGEEGSEDDDSDSEEEHVDG